MSKERWSSQLGVIMSVAGMAVGLGNFLRFPGKAAQYGGIFMIPYFVSLLVLGIPIAWAEWTMGRYGGSQGYHSSPGIFSVIWKHRASPYLGALALLVPFVVYTYYVYIEAWCLAYAWYYAVGTFPLSTDAGPQRYSVFFNEFVGTLGNGALFEKNIFPVGVFFLVLVFLFNLWIVYRGINRGIETFCKWAMPILLVCALIVLARVLSLGTPDPTHPDRNVINGLGLMWNPRPVAAGASVFSALWNPQMWLDAAGQVFFTLGVGFGIAMCYTSYMGPDEDVALSSLSACATNELSEVCLGGLITIPAAFVFLGAAPLSHVLGSTLGLGFHALPQIFEYMPFGSFFGFLWFFLLFLAAIASSISMVQPVVAFFEEGFEISRQRAVALMAVPAAVGCGLVVYFSQGLLALDTMDFWVGSLLIFTLGTAVVLVFAWAFPLEKGWQELMRGADFPVPSIVRMLLKWVCPIYLLVILLSWIVQSAKNYVHILLNHVGAALSMGFILASALMFCWAIHYAKSRGFMAQHEPRSEP